MRAFTRTVDAAWRRTSYSSLSAVRAETVVDAVASEPEVVGKDDENVSLVSRRAVNGPSRDPTTDLPSPMANLPVGATFGSLVHAVLEHADPAAADFRAELLGHIDEQRGWWPVELDRAELADALVAVCDSPLGGPDGPLAGVTLRGVALSDRLREMDFELPLGGGDVRDRTADVRPVGDLAPLLERHLPEGDPVRAYAVPLRGPLGDQPLRGYLTGSVDVVLRVPTPDGPRFHVVDYKTNWLGPIDEPLTAAAYRARGTGRGDGALRLPAAGPAVRRRAAPLPALAVAGLRPGAAPRRGAVPLRPRHVRARDPGRRRDAVRGVHLARAGAARRGALRTTRGTGGGDVTELFEPTSEHDWRLARGRTGLLAAFNDGLLLTAADLHVAARVGALGREDDERVLLALALAVRAVRRGSVCLSLDEVRADAPDLPWPDAAAWADAVRRSTLVEQGVLRWDHDLLYLDRYHRLETQVRDDLVARTAQPPPLVDEARLAAAVAQVRGDEHASPEQVGAAETAVRRWTTILTGGPGTGKTTTVARMLALLADQAAARGDRISVALTAPTGKAASRLQEAVSARAGRADRRTGGGGPARSSPGRHPAPAARLAARQRDPVQARPRQPAQARRGGGRRVVDGRADDDGPAARGAAPRQPADPGRRPRAADVGRRGRGAERPGPRVRRAGRLPGRRADHELPLRAGHQGAGRRAAHRGSRTTVLDVLRTPSDQVSFVEASSEDDLVAVLRPSAVAAAALVRERAEAEDARGALDALDGHRLLCAHREGPFGVRRWNGLVERWLAEEVGDLGGGAGWYVGRPLLATTNDYALDVYNGEIGVVVRQGLRRRVFISGAGTQRLRDFAPGRLDAVETMHAMTIHKAQGSQADRRHGAAARGGLPAADPRAVLHRGHPRPSSTCGWSAPRPPSAPPSRPRLPGLGSRRAAARL